jgi:glycosyltransferase involved in cell wall biosynthesis
MFSRDLSVAVCIPTFNQAAYLAEAVRSALDQEFPVNEVWVSDDASTDETAEVLQRLMIEDSRLRVNSNLERLGIAGNVNKLLRLTQAEFIVRLDSDDVLDNRYVGSMIDAFERWPDAGFFHCNSYKIDGRGTVCGSLLAPRTEEYKSGADTFLSCPYNYGVAANICGFRRAMLEALNYTEGRPEYVEDFDLWCRAAIADYGNAFNHQRLAHYRVWTDAGGVRLRRKETELRGLIRVFEEVIEPEWRKRNLPWRDIRRGRFRHALQHIPYLSEVPLSPAEQSTISSLVLRLGNNSPSVHLLAAVGRSPVRSLLLGLRDGMRWMASLKRTGAHRRIAQASKLAP